MRLPLKTIIVEDEIEDLFVLKEFLKPHKSLIAISEENIANSFESARNILMSQSFDLSFLDIELDNNSECYELIETFGKSHFGIITFSTKIKTAFFENLDILRGCLYLGKPYSSNRMKVFCEELRDRVALINSTDKKYYPLWLKEKSNEFLVEQNSIIYIEVRGTLCSIYYLDGVVDKKHSITKTLKEYEGVLNPEIFFRLSDKYLINMNFFAYLGGGSLKLKIKDTKKEFSLPLSEKDRARLHARYKI